jgi:hypothetical protein
MSQTHKNGAVAHRAAKKAVKKTGTAMVVAKRAQARRLAKHTRATLKELPGRTTRLIKSHPVRVLLGATALGFVVAKLRGII